MSASSRPSTSNPHPSSHHDRPHTHHDDDSRSSSTTGTSSSSSGSSPRLPNPGALLPPLGPPMAGPSGGTAKPGGPILANEILDPELQLHHHRHTSPPNPVPEKCLTFCSQSQDNQPICRMFCLRRRRPIISQAEQLARLRPSARDHDHDPYAVPVPATGSRRSKEHEEGWSWSPFEALQRRAALWSFIYVKGTPDGVVGRYMEELEGDDGNRDFGSISRTATDLQRRKATDGWEYLDWGEHGSLLHLPFTSLLAPIISLPDNIARVFAPSLNLINLYRTSFTDGAQERNLDRLRTEFANGGAFTFFSKLNAHYWKKISERKAEIDKQREKQREAVEKALTDQKAKIIQEKMEKYEAARREQEE